MNTYTHICFLNKIKEFFYSVNKGIRVIEEINDTENSKSIEKNQ